MTKRIWELDVLRGLWILLMFAIHITYDLVILFDVVDLKDPALFNWSQEWGGTLFLVISGVCATLGRHPVRRGLQVLGCGAVISLVTAGMYFLGFAGRDIIIYFGVLQCLGCCMLLWPLFRKGNPWLLGVLGLILALLGLYLVDNVLVDFPWLVPFGIMNRGFASSDYFPLLPNFGYFLVGACIGKTLYRNKTSLMPNVNTANPIIRFFTFFGKHSLIIYLVHQPVFAGLILLFLQIF